MAIVSMGPRMWWKNLRKWIYPRELHKTEGQLLSSCMLCENYHSTRSIFICRQFEYKSSFCALGRADLGFIFDISLYQRAPFSTSVTYEARRLVPLRSRQLVRVAGFDAPKFLQGITTQDVRLFYPYLSETSLKQCDPIWRGQRKPERRTGYRLETLCSKFSVGTDEVQIIASELGILKCCINTDSHWTERKDGVFSALECGSCDAIKVAYHHQMSSALNIALSLMYKPLLPFAVANSQGKVLADGLLVLIDSGVPSFILDIDSTISSRLMAYMQRHILSARVTIDLLEDMKVFQIMPVSLPYTGNDLTRAMLKEKGCTSTVGWRPKPVLGSSVLISTYADVSNSVDTIFHLDETHELKREGKEVGFLCADTRHRLLGHRVYCKINSHCSAIVEHKKQINRTKQTESVYICNNQENPIPYVAETCTDGAIMNDASLTPLDRFYNIYRWLLGICEGPSEIGISKHLAVSVNLDWTGHIYGGNKGCFIGQEVLTRAIHQQINRRRIAVILKEGEGAQESESDTLASYKDEHRAAEEQNANIQRLRANVIRWSAVLDKLNSCTIINRISSVSDENNRIELKGKLPLKMAQPSALVGAKLLKDDLNKRCSTTKSNELGTILAFDEESGVGLCILRSRPGDPELGEFTDYMDFLLKLRERQITVKLQPNLKGGPLDSTYTIIPPLPILEHCKAQQE